jgi:hypothetical protein
MAELHVGAGFALRTLAQAAAEAKGGDTVIVHAGVYAAGFRPPAGTTWVGAEGEERPVIDGGWKGGNLSPADANGYGVMVSAAGVTLRDFEVRNIAGRGVVIGPGGDGLVLEDFEIHHTFSGGLACNGSGKAIADIAIRRGHVHDISLSGRWRETPVSGCFLFKDANNLLVEDVLIERGHGEGIAAGFRSNGVMFRRVTVCDTTHLAMYVANCATNVLVEECIVYQSGVDEFRQSDGDVGAGFVIGDEVAEGRDDNRPRSENVTMRRCVAVNCVQALQVRNGTKVKGGLLDGYDTRIQNLVVERCTFVGGPNTRVGIGAGENDQGAKVKGVIRDCVMDARVVAVQKTVLRLRPVAHLQRLNAIDGHTAPHGDVLRARPIVVPALCHLIPDDEPRAHVAVTLPKLIHPRLIDDALLYQHVRSAVGHVHGQVRRIAHRHTAEHHAVGAKTGGDTLAVAALDQHVLY